jgi:membrane protein implicated in regulation of membrane protease activity
MSALFADVHPAIIWSVAAIILAIAEMVLPGTFLVWLGLAAAFTAGLAVVVPLSLPFQLLAFAIFSALAVSGGRLWYLARPVEPEDPLLNDRSARMIGRQVLVIEAITHGHGRVRVDDGSWQATGPDTPAGAYVVVTEVSGSTLTVSPLPAQPPG